MELQIELPIETPSSSVISATNMNKLRDEFLADGKMALVMLCESHESLRKECIRWMSRVKSLEARVERATYILGGLD